jgi:hypothetical protein
LRLACRELRLLLPQRQEASRKRPATEPQGDVSQVLKNFRKFLRQKLL